MQGFQYEMMSLPKKPVIHCISLPDSGAPSHPLLNYKEDIQVCPLHFLWSVVVFFTSRHSDGGWQKACGRKTSVGRSRGTLDSKDDDNLTTAAAAAVRDFLHPVMFSHKENMK